MNSDESSFRCAPPAKVSISDADSKVLCPLQVPFQISASINSGKNCTLGKGTYGIVRTGTVVVNDRIDKNENAFKTFLGKDGVAFSQTVLREIIPLCCLPEHENVLKPRLVYADDKNRIHFSSEKMKCNLYERLKTTASSVDQKLMWSMQLIRAVNHMHANGFLHRDIKLENIFLDDRDNVVLGDLGMSRYSSPFVEARFSSGVCTLWTRAPELCAYAIDVRKNSRELSYDASVDCWSLGITVLSIFASRYFFQGKDEEDMLKLIFATVGKPSEDTTSEAWCLRRETRNSKIRWKMIAQNSTLLSKNTEDVVDSLILECSRRRIIAHPDLIRSIVPLLAIEPEKRGSANEVLKTPFWKGVEQDISIVKTKIKKFVPLETEKKIGKEREAVLEEKLLFVSLNYYGLDTPEPRCSITQKTTQTNEDQIYESCTTRGILRLAVTEWILSLQKSLSLLPLTIIDSIFFWERVRDLVDVQVKNEMVLAAACCSLVSKIHEYVQYPSQRWIRCLSNTATVEELVKYEMLALKTSNCGVFTCSSKQKHPISVLSDLKLDLGQSDRDKILLSLCSLMAKHHTQDFGIEKLISDSLLTHVV